MYNMCQLIAYFYNKNLIVILKVQIVNYGEKKIKLL